MLHLGNVPASSTLYIPFATYGKTNGESITLTGLAVTDVEIYKNGSTTQRASDAGYALLDTDGIDFDGITGIHGFSIDLSDNTDAGFYSVGAFYWVVVSAVTVDSQTVNFIAATFRIVAAENVAGYPVVDEGAISGDTTAADNHEKAYDGTGYNVGGGSVVAASVTGNVGGLVVGTVGGISGVDFPANFDLLGITSLGTIGAVDAISAGGITAASIADNAIDAGAIAADAVTKIQSGLSTLTAEDVNFEVDAAMTAIHLDHLFATDYDPASKPGTATALLNELIENDGGVSRFTANALEQAPSGSGASAETIADAVWDEVASGHTTAGTFGAFLNKLHSIFTGITWLAPWLRTPMRSDPPDAQTLKEINQGGGTYDPRKHSLQARADD